MNSGLRTTLAELLESGSDSNPALDELLRDYVEYHLVFIAIGGLLLVAFAALAIFSWRRFRSTPNSENRRWSFERASYLLFAVSSGAFALMVALITAANASNVADPRHGFSGALGMIGTPRAGTRAADLHQAFTTWLQSGQTEIPDVVRSRIDDRLAWQRPKAIICSALLVLALLLSGYIWRTLIRQSRTRQTGWRAKDLALLATGVVAGPVCVLLMAMVIGNAQASVAPLSMTLFYG